MAAVALYTVEGVEDDSAVRSYVCAGSLTTGLQDHPNAFFLPRLQGASITLEQLRECFPLGHIGEFKFSYLVRFE